MTTTLDSLEAAFSHANDVIANVKPEQYANPTPCTQWDVQALLQHFVTATAMFPYVVRGGEPDPAQMAALASSDDLAAEFAKASADTLAAWREPGVFEREIQFSIGPVPAEVAAGFNVQEVLAHTWDLAVATGQDPALPSPAVDNALEFARQTLKPEYRGADGPIGPEFAAPGGGSATDRFVAFLSRAPSRPGGRLSRRAARAGG
jgi:uncharacterized protein (TIGR03086 family)